ncbi:VOC family protein [Reichenbachiella versicolor]|uniref:VOC family protein n=1 Tax=Reichenbachiella versicolor TaxID=1821036 RepID=UPI000D6E3ECA|nr:VOC family protein [Reichenbachiella versicolor]
MTNAINWFEIPVIDFERAKTFYETVLGAKMMPFDMGGMKSAFFPADLENGIGGCILKSEGFEPSTTGTLVYLNGGDDLQIPLSRVEEAGGKVTLAKTDIGENGFMAKFIDSEGNQVALHSMK